MSSNSVVYWGTGRRKTSVARVRLVPGNGTITINGRPGDNYLNYNPAYISAVGTELDSRVGPRSGTTKAQTVSLRSGGSPIS